LFLVNIAAIGKPQSIISVKSTVTTATLTITADNKTKVYGAANPPLTLSFSGFANNDGVGQLVYPPLVSTTAVISSLPGNYPITVSDAYSLNYTINYVQGMLTVTPDVIIPSAFTPNGDGINDKWDIEKIGAYPKCTVQVFNRYGGLVFSSIGYGDPWDGTYKGSVLPPGTYYYIVNLKSGVPLLSGYVAVIR
jgi:gliding motility-associated-like protein